MDNSFVDMGKEDINRVPRALTNSLNSKLMDQLYDLIPGTNVVVDLIVFLSQHQISDLFGNRGSPYKTFVKKWVITVRLCEQSFRKKC